MAKMVLTNAYVQLNAVDLSDHVKSVTLNYSAEAVDDTAMGDTTKSRIGGLKDWSLEIEFQQDYASGKVDATLFDLVGTTFAVAVRPVNTTISSTNPEYQGTGLLESYKPMGGSVGELHMAPVTIQASSALVRDTTP